MKRKYIYLISLILAAVALFLYFNSNNSSDRKIEYTTAKALIGSISSTVTANGTIKPVERVEIRSTVDGTVEEILKDDNSEVKKGEVLARLDKTLYRNRLNEARSKLNKTENDLNLRKKILDSDKTLFGKQLISKQEYEESLSKYKSALASYEEAKSSFEIARTNLEDTSIRSLIDGIILSSNINVGQAVSPAENNKPLFVVVSRLDKMNLVSGVSESDISRVKTGQKIKFSVSAYPDSEFEGKVVRISNDPVTENNIVTYEVTSEIDNTDMKFKPGMTAEVDIITSVKENILMVPNSALRVVPPDSDLNIEARNNNKHFVWIKKGNSGINSIEVTPGISDDIHTEIVKGSLSPGDEVITGFTKSPGSESDSLITLPQPKRF